jgi:K+-transporting ATPase A subunit
MPQAVTIATISSGAGAWFVASGVLMVLKAQLGPYWTDLANRLTTILLPIVLVEVAILATGGGVWWLYVIGALNGLLAATGVSKTQQAYDARQVKKQLQAVNVS